MTPPVVCFLSDYGLTDGFVGVCHAVIARVCPSARVIDLAHGIAPHDVAAGAAALAGCIAYLPADAVVFADVDPGEPGSRRAIGVVAADGRRFVGPDNGLLWPSVTECGGAVEVVDVSESPIALRPIAPTFVGRDVLAPVAAALAGGASLADLGSPSAPDGLRRLRTSRAVPEGDGLLARVLSIDAFGNLELDARPAQLSALGATVGDRISLAVSGIPCREVIWGRHFGDVAAGELLLFTDPQTRLALAVNRASAAARLNASVGDRVRIVPVS